MGKTESGAVWLDKKFLSPYGYWQFWRNIDDRDVLKFIKIFTDLDVNEIRDKNINDLKILLANETTTMLHGEDSSRIAEETARKTFEENSTGSALPTVKINFLKNKKINIIDIIILTKMEKSKSEIRRLIKSNGIKINESIFKDKFIKLSLGKKRHIKIQVAD